MLDPPSDWNDRDSSQAIVFIRHTHTHVSARQPAHCIVVHIQAPDTLNSVDCSSSMESALCSHKISLPSYDTLYFVISLLSLSLSLPPPLLLRVVIEIVHRFGDKRERTIAPRKLYMRPSKCIRFKPSDTLIYGRAFLCHPFHRRSDSNQA